MSRRIVEAKTMGYPLDEQWLNRRRPINPIVTCRMTRCREQDRCRGRVLDLTTARMGICPAQTLGDLGADVVKFEAKAGVTR